MSTRLIEQLRAKYPALAKRSKRAPLAAIRLFCLECMGGDHNEVTACTAPLCSLYPFRFGRGFRKTGPVNREQSPDGTFRRAGTGVAGSGGVTGQP